MIPWTVDSQAPLSMGFSRKEYWNRLPFPPPGDLPDLRDRTCTSCVSCIGRQILYHCATWDALVTLIFIDNLSLKMVIIFVYLFWSLSKFPNFLFQWSDQNYRKKLTMVNSLDKFLLCLLHFFFRIRSEGCVVCGLEMHWGSFSTINFYWSIVALASQVAQW